MTFSFLKTFVVGLILIFFCVNTQSSPNEIIAESEKIELTEEFESQLSFGNLIPNFLSIFSDLLKIPNSEIQPHKIFPQTNSHYSFHYQKPHTGIDPPFTA